ncbi:MgtC/SapB family protein [Bradyrhizobium ontarionense]|uniref:MgtC/SapB family protein n=1 Tax=Bradyrhizobium ontarionense TaxID=2898149 RepID=A0ABY3RKB1_9BRAD|nr:MgtC/SapB family protein [Bradyrhizobium sp. A19]UFZ07806.1 MgtC/SapB family protein [Bradyrhizobium sp. A19]
MFPIEPVILNLAVALGIGLLIGAERERRKGAGPSRAPAGIRTFAVASVAGAVSFLAGGPVLFAILTAGVVVLVAVAYWRGREDDPGLTTEVGLTVTVLLGGLSMQRPALAGGLGVVVVVLLASKSRLHRFVGSVLTEDELQDALVFAAATLVVLPLVPDRPMGPYGALNPHAIWVIVILIMAISAAGYVAVRFLGARFGLPLAGLASGFISSTATIAAMGARVAKAKETLAAAVAGAVLSTIATVLQMALVLAATSMPTLLSLAGPLACAGLAAAVYGILFTGLALRQRADAEPQKGRAFSLPAACLFALTLSVILVASAALRDAFGEDGVIVAAALAGFADTHAAAISAASLVASGKLTAADAVLPILAGLSTNTLSKMLLAASSGGVSFAARVIPGLILVALAAWAGAFYNPFVR